MYTEEQVAPYLGLLVMMLEKLGGEFTYNVAELERVAFHNHDKTIYQTRNDAKNEVTIKLAKATHVNVGEEDV